MNKPASSARTSFLEAISLDCHPANVSECGYAVCDAGGLSVLVFGAESRLFATENRCSHLRKAPAGGRLIRGQIVCPQHGAAFDIRTGKALSFPAVFPVRSFIVNETENEISISINMPR